MRNTNAGAIYPSISTLEGFNVPLIELYSPKNWCIIFNHVTGVGIMSQPPTGGWPMFISTNVLCWLLTQLITLRDTWITIEAKDDLVLYVSTMKQSSGGGSYLVIWCAMHSVFTMSVLLRLMLCWLFLFFNWMTHWVLILLQLFGWPIRSARFIIANQNSMIHICYCMIYKFHYY